jgi:hypothetical protein
MLLRATGIMNFAVIPRLVKLPHSVSAVIRCASVALALCQVSALAQPLPARDATTPAESRLPPGFFIPLDAFTKPSANVPSTPALKKAQPAPGPVRHVQPLSMKRSVTVTLYASPSTRNYFAKGGLDAQAGIAAWEVFLRKYRFPYQVVSSPAKLERQEPGLLLLSSLVALSDPEKRAIADFRNRGGSVLSSWLTGVRNEHGQWSGFDFMENVLDVKVLGTHADNPDDTFLMPYGDNPVTHHLPAGYRIWLERIKQWHPLRLSGGHAAAQIMNWSRTYAPDRAGAAIVFDERAQASGQLSRSVVLGYPERLWTSADPKLLEAVTHNALMWLLHQPGAYKSAWPYPYASALVLSIDAPGGVSDSDLSMAKMFKDAGAPATYYVLSANAAKSAPAVGRLQAMGHEVGYLGDRFDDFKNQPPVVQARRFDTMRKEIRDAGISAAADAGFSPPMESFDKTTKALLRERAFGHFMASMDETEARLPVIDSVDLHVGRPMVVLPRTHRGIEPVLAENYAEQGMGIFLDELEMSEQMAGVSIIKVPPQSFVTPEEWARLFAHLNGRSQRVWLATASQVAESWRQRARVDVRLDSGDAPLLTVTVRGNSPLKQAVAVWVNLPVSHSRLRLSTPVAYPHSPKIAVVDAWRAAVLLDGLAPGVYRWTLHFDPR